MNRPEVAKLLAHCAAFDNRTIGEADVLAWHEVIGHLSFEEAQEAVRSWYGEHRERIMPADIRGIVKIMRTARDKTLEEATAVPDADPDDVAAYIEAVRENRMKTIDAEDLKERPQLRTFGAGIWKTPPDVKEITRGKDG